MDFLSKLIKKATSDKTVNELFKNLAGSQDSSSRPSWSESASPRRERNGFSWGPDMPDEENQFTFNGSYVDYFESVLRAEFPAYQIVSEGHPHTDGVVFTFYQGGACAGAVEVLPEEASSWNRFREQCRKNGVPYTRFYHDHDGWWNTRSYVVCRVKTMLGI